MAYFEQYQRVKRYLNKIECQNRDKTEYLDDLYSFFQNCWHLKDWLKNDPVTNGVLNDRIIFDEAFNYDSLKICHDVANGSKHLVLKTPSSKKAKIGGSNIIVTVNEVIGTLMSQVTVSFKPYIILDDYSTKDALAVAKDAVNAWETIMSKYNLI